MASLDNSHDKALLYYVSPVRITNVQIQFLKKECSVVLMVLLDVLFYKKCE